MQTRIIAIYLYFSYRSPNLQRNLTGAFDFQVHRITRDLYFICGHTRLCTCSNQPALQQQQR